MVHEPFVPSINWRWTLMGIWQRLQLWALRFTADVIFASIESWAQRFAAAEPHRPVYHLPVGSNLPDGRPFRAQERRRLRVNQNELVLACLGQRDRTRLPDRIVETCNILYEAGWPVTLLNLGAGPLPLDGLNRGVVVHAPGVIPADQLSRWLSAADIFLAPYSEGASTRRTTLMAAMQHGLPIVTTDGALTDALLRQSQALRLVAVSRVNRFPEVVLRLANSPHERRALGRSARLFYEEHFTWPVIANRLLELLDKALMPSPVGANW
jgi:glycosyltransferase involved in cell wall biosynthesis